MPLWAQILGLVLLLACSAFFSISETSLMALNRYRLKHLAAQGHRGAQRVLEMLQRTDALLGTILLGNNVINAALTALVTSLAINWFGNDDTVLALATTLVAFLIIVFAEITPKVIGATWPERIALPSSAVLRVLMRLASPAVGFVNLFVNFLLKPLAINQNSSQSQALSIEELRSVVLEAGHFIPSKNRSILVNLFDLDSLVVDDVMTPRGRIEALNLREDEANLRRQITTCFHNKLLVYDGDINRVLGILHVRKVLPLLTSMGGEGLTHESLRSVLVEPYFIPSGTQCLTQLQNFQEQRQRLGLVVDEYGDLQGLVALEDIVEEMVGEFTTNAPGADPMALKWNDQGEIFVEASALLRDLNRRLQLNFRLDGPKTLNGLVLEHLEQMPDGDVSLRIAGVTIEVVQSQNRAISRVKLRKI